MRSFSLRLPTLHVSRNIWDHPIRPTTALRRFGKAFLETEGDDRYLRSSRGWIEKNPRKGAATAVITVVFA